MHNWFDFCIFDARNQHIMKKTFYILFILLALAACKKKDEKPDKAPILCRQWKCHEIDNYPCTSILTLNPDGTGSFTGAVDYTVIWYFINDQAGLHLRFMDAATVAMDEDCPIESLTQSEFKYLQPSNNRHHYYIPGP